MYPSHLDHISKKRKYSVLKVLFRLQYVMVLYSRTRLIPTRFKAGELDTYLQELSWVRLG